VRRLKLLLAGVRLLTAGAFVVAGLAGPVASLADDTSANPDVQAVEAKYAKVDVIQADFTQTTHNATFGDDTQSGDVTLKRPKKMFWNFTSGDKKQFVTDGSTMWVYTATDNQVIKYGDVGGASTGTTAESMLQSLDKLDEVFTVTTVPSPTGHQLDLAPKKEGQVKKVHIEFDGYYVVNRVVITDAFDGQTELSFQNVKLNGNVPDSTFQFQVPAGAQVVDAGGPAAPADAGTTPSAPPGGQN